jgi:predicted SprT family Zn-dependent metalloprotease
MVFSREFVKAAGSGTARRLRGMVRTWARTWQLPLLSTEVNVQPNLRLKSTVARYRRDTRTIEVGARFFSLGTRQAEILAHEMAHAAIDIRHGRAVKVHGQEWKALVRAVGFAPQTCLAVARARPAPPGATRSSRYAHRCPVCHMVRVSRRPIRGWRCRSCIEAGLTGTLQITRVVRTR